MDLQAVIACLETKERCEEFIARLKTAGENSNPVMQVKNAMTELNMHKAPKGIFEKTTLQHIFRFSNANECFQSFRLVCKPWKNSVETIRFNRAPDELIFSKLNSQLKDGNTSSKHYFARYLSAFRKFELPQRRFIAPENLDAHKIFLQYKDLILENMKKLNEITVDCEHSWFNSHYEPFLLQMLKNCNKTLRFLYLPKFIIPAEINFPNMTKLTLTIGFDIRIEDFETTFPQILTQMENLNAVNLDIVDQWQPICQNICENYSTHCISGSIFSLNLNSVPLQIVENANNLKRRLENHQNKSQIRYIHSYIMDCDDPMTFGWNNYQKIFNQCKNLKEIELVTGIERKNFITEVLPNLNLDYQKIWKNRISYFQKRGIRLVDKNQIYGNENLRNKVAKEAGISWRFHFY